MLKLLKLCAILLALTFAVTAAPQDKKQAATSHWNYDEALRWKEHFSSCGGEHQSPINLDLKKVNVVNYPKFNFTNYDKAFTEMVTNNGHTVMMKLDKTTDVPFISGGGLSGRYNFAQLHFHWGKDTLRGSEHLIGGHQYPAELHMVHYNTKYGTLNDALPFPDGLAVLGIMIELEARDNVAFRHLEHFEDIITSDANKNSYLSYSIPLSDLLPDSTDSFYRYSGSLTTPGCNEDVIWTVFDTPIAISERQLNQFRMLRDSEGRPMEDNFRPVQEIHDREVSYRPDEAARSG